MRRALLALLLLATGAGLGCSSLTATYNCAGSGADPGQCNEQGGGVCATSNGESYCAYPDPSCGSGYYSFGASAGSSAGACIPPPMQTVDASIPIPPDSYTPDAPGGADVCLGDGSAWCISAANATTPITFGSDTIFSHGDGEHASACTGSATVDGVTFCVVGASQITFLGAVTIDDTAGTFPIAFVSAGTITIAGAINAGSQKGRSFDPPGMSIATCIKGDGGASKNGGAGGGAGGSYGTSGGNGGNGNGANAAETSTAIATAILGSCPGGDGGVSGFDFETTHGGSPGGVVYLVASSGIAIDTGGSLDVSGAGGTGGVQGSEGGGGGGTGGFVAFDTPTLMLAGSVDASGGGGGGGATQSKLGFFTAGGDGSDGGGAVAGGGTGGGGDGGFGSGQGAGGQNENSNQGGGGGGGGVGVIWLVGTPGPEVTSAGGALQGVVIQHP